MGLSIPGELAELLNELGYTWPQSDETAMWELGQLWMDLASATGEAVEEAQAVAGGLPSETSGADVETFLTRWNSSGSAMEALDTGAAGALAVGGALLACSSVVLVLKTQLIVQLSVLAMQMTQAIATAAQTMGMSLLEIPLHKKSASLAIDLLINEAIEAVLD